MSLFLRVLVMLHLCGLVVMAGTTVVDYVTFKTFCRMADAGDSRAQGLLPIMAQYGNLVRTGAATLILTGLAMLVLTKGIWWEQLWFRIKMGLVILLILNGMLVGNSLGLKFRKMIVNGSGPGIADVRVNLNRFYLVQLAIFLLIILASTIRPDQIRLNK
ncbi:hypothetical protein ACTHGU_04970 [Chitinophagaceae bacterium MMS25-I14]